jgi:protein gp37
MGEGSAIEWTDATWNPVTGCSKVSAGCAHCYAERFSVRLQAMGQANYCNGFKVTMHPRMLDTPEKWRQPRHIFVNSMSDLFHEEVPVDFIRAVFRTMVRADWHRYQVLTKRADRLVELAPSLPWPRNVWMGVTVENEQFLSRIDRLRETPAKVKFLSLEPLLGPLSGLDLNGIDWVIVGGESGPGARPMQPDWVRAIRDECVRLRVPFFFKQWGGVQKKKAGRELDGRAWDQMPPHVK